MWKQEPEGRQLNGDCWDCSGDTLYSYFYLFANRHWTCKTSFDIEYKIHIQIGHALLCEQVYWNYCISSKIHMDFHVQITQNFLQLFPWKNQLKRGRLVLLWLGYQRPCSSLLLLTFYLMKFVGYSLYVWKEVLPLKFLSLR